MPTQFSWIPFYRELTQRLLSFEERQEELVQLMEEMRAAGLPMMFLQENLPDGAHAVDELEYRDCRQSGLEEEQQAIPSGPC